MSQIPFNYLFLCVIFIVILVIIILIIFILSSRKQNALNQEIINKLQNDLNITKQNLYEYNLLLMQNVNDIKMAVNNNINSLENIFRDKKARGTFGEFSLYDILANVYGGEGTFYKRQYKLANGNIVDAVIFGKTMHENLFIDSKFPLNNYRLMVDKSVDAETSLLATKAFKIDLKKHINDISSKYLNCEDSLSFALMYIPAEGVYSEIYDSFSDIIDYGFSHSVLIVGPSTLLAFISAIKSIYTDYVRNEKTELITEALIKLQNEFLQFDKRSKKLFDDYSKIANDFHDLQITTNKLIKDFNKINEGEFIDG